MFEELNQEFSGLSLSSKAIKLYLITRYRKNNYLFICILKRYFAIFVALKI